MSIDAMRREYEGRPLAPEDVAGDPFAFFRHWFEEATAAMGDIANAMSLATVDAAGRPSVRFVLLKGIEESGLRFFTNVRSRKGRELEANPHVALALFWEPLHRQVRIEGRAVLLPEETCDAYFAQRPRDSRIAALASPQSEVLADRAELERRVAAVEAEVGEGEVPRPVHWGGYAVNPESFEFWQGQANRLHDRVLCLRAGDSWRCERLAP